MRTVFFLLLLTNIGFFAWNYFGGLQASGDAQLVDQQLHPEAIRLLTTEQLAALVDLERAFAFEKHRRCMGVDSSNMRMGGGVRKKCKDPLLDARVGCH
jgi:hypothetical protein